jgi:UDP:flavonoid glycosyltransferase YjiC (YdhE family)
MRVLLSTSGSRGDVESQLALAVRLQEAGTGVRLCAPPANAERSAEAGVPFVPVGQAMRMMLQDGMAPPSPEDERRMAAAAVAVQFDHLPAAAEGCDAVVATGELSAAVAARSVAEKLGIPYFYAAYSPAYLPSASYPPPLDEPLAPGVTGNQALWDQRAKDFGERFGEAVNDLRAGIGLPPVADIFRFGYTDRPWLASDPVLAPLQSGVDAVQTGAWFVPDQRPLSPEVEAFLAAGPPPVYVGFGSTAETADAAQVALAVVRAQGRRAILLRGWADAALPDDATDCLAIDEANFHRLFGRVAAVIHHGGAGTTTAAALAGSPQVVIAQYTDQPYFAERVADLGIGVAHDGPDPSFGSLSDALTTALDPATGARAAEVAGAIRTDGPAVAARLLHDEIRRATTPAAA